MVFVAVNPIHAFGVPVGPYTGTMDGTPVPLYCGDWANDVLVGQGWEANLSPITAGAVLTDTRYGSMTDALALYQQAAWLTLQYVSQPTSQWGDINATIWQLFNSATAPVPSAWWWLDQARANYTAADYRNFRVVTNLGPLALTGQIQELLTVVPDEVPEPGVQLPVGVALVGLSWAWRRAKKRRMQKQG